MIKTENSLCMYASYAFHWEKLESVAATNATLSSFRDWHTIERKKNKTDISVCILDMK